MSDDACQGKPDGELVPDVSDGSKFYECMFGEVVHHYCCMTGTAFCPETQLCEWDNTPPWVCTFAPIPTAANWCEPPNGTQPCQETKQRSISATTYKSYKTSLIGNLCVPDEVHYTCKPGYYGGNGPVDNCTRCPPLIDALGESHPRWSNYDTTSVTGCYLDPPYTPICQHSEIRGGRQPVFADPKDRRSFYECDYSRGYTETTYVNGVLTTLTDGYPTWKGCCITGTYFNPAEDLCDWPENANPNNPAPIPSGECVSNIVGGCPSGYYGYDPAHCTKCPVHTDGTPGQTLPDTNYLIEHCRLFTGSDISGTFEYTDARPGYHPNGCEYAR